MLVVVIVLLLVLMMYGTDTCVCCWRCVVGVLVMLVLTLLLNTSSNTLSSIYQSSFINTSIPSHHPPLTNPLTGAGGSAPKHIEQFLKEGHLRWDSLGEYLAIAVSLEHLGETTNNKRALQLSKALNNAIERLLQNRKSPGRKVNLLTESIDRTN